MNKSNQYQAQSQKLSAQEQNYYISSCYFGKSNTKGSIYLSTTKNTIKFLVDTTTFTNCSNNGEGGCIYYGTEGQFVQDRICSFSLKVNSWKTEGVYCKIDVSDSNSYKNYIYASSISKSGDESFLGMNTLYLINGQIQIKSINISFSKIYCRDFYYAFSYSSGSNSSFSTFTNSTSGSTINYYKLRHTDSAEVFNIINCNVLNNKNASILQALYDTSSSCLSLIHI